MEFLFRIAAIFLTLLETTKGEYGDRIKNATITWGGNLVMEESRHAAYAVQRPGYAPHTELPITFKAPYVNARDYWTESSRRTVLDYVPYSPQDLIPRPLNDGINTFYDLMQQFFGADDPQQRYRRPQPPPPPQPPPRQPYEFENPYHQRPAQPYYLPRPKPLQASIQKLEPNPYASQQYNNYPQFVKIVNDVLVENAYRHPEPVIEKPAFIPDYAVPPTTYKPKSAYHARPVPQIFPVSIQDQLPPAHPGQDTRIPYVTSSPITTTPESTTVQWPVGVDTTPGTRVVFPAPTEIVPLDISIDVRNAGKTSYVKRPVVFETTTVSSPPEITTQEVTTTTSTTTTRSEIETRTRAPQTTSPPPTTQLIETTSRPTTTTEKIISTTVTPAVTLTTSESPATTDAGVGESHLLNTVEPLEEIRFGAPFPKKLEPRKSTTDSTTPSADYVTDLTVQGLNDINAIHASIPQHSTPFNGSLIGYVLEKYNATAPPPKVIPIDDGLSLDAKILRDTNWDGYQPVIPTTDRVAQTTIWTTTPAFTTPTTEIPTTTTYIPEETTFVTTTEPTPVEKAKETAIISSRITFSQSARQRHRNRETTTQEVIITPRTDEVTIPNDVSPTSPSTTTRRGRKYERRHRVQNQVQFSKRRHDDDEMRSSEHLLTSTTEATLRRRKYHRRQRVHNFTQFSDHRVTTPGPVKLGTLTRPFHPKRTRPNATLTFKRNSKRVQEVSSTILPIESKPLSEEELLARRNLYNRRKSTSHVRSSREREDQSEPFVDE